MLPCRSASATPQPESENLEGVLRAIKSLVMVVEKHVSAGGRSKDMEIKGSTIEHFKRIGPHEFKGAPDSMEVESWIMQMEKILDVIGCTKVQKVSFATFILGGEVEHWWRVTRETLPLDEDESLICAMFLEAFYENFFLESVLDEELKFMELV